MHSSIARISACLVLSLATLRLAVNAASVAPAVAVTVTEEDRQCFESEKVLHDATGRCYKLLTKGPCAQGEWIVLQPPPKDPLQEIRIRGVCRQDRCPERDMYFWPETKSCVQGRDEDKMCGAHNTVELVNNVFGEGECRCRRDPPHERLNGDPANACHRLYSRGPCAHGEVLRYADEDADFPTCRKDMCSREKLALQLSGKIQRDALMAPWNGSCYELGTQGPCPVNSIFKVESGNLPACLELPADVFDFGKPSNCFADEHGQCQTSVGTSNRRDTGEEYRQKLFQNMRKRRHVHRRNHKTAKHLL